MQEVEALRSTRGNDSEFLRRKYGRLMILSFDGLQNAEGGQHFELLLR